MAMKLVWGDKTAMAKVYKSRIGLWVMSVLFYHAASWWGGTR